MQQHMKRSHAEAGQSQVAVTDVGMSDASDRSLLATPVIPGSSVPVKDRPTLPDGNPAVEQWHRCRRTGCEGTFMKVRTILAASIPKMSRNLTLALETKPQLARKKRRTARRAAVWLRLGGMFERVRDRALLLAPTTRLLTNGAPMDRFQTSTELINHQRTHTDHLFLWHQRGCCKK